MSNSDECKPRIIHGIKKINTGRYTIGQEIVTDHVLIRPTTDPWRVRKWEVFPVKPRTAYIIGIRRLSNGVVDGDREDGFVYCANEYFKALLVVETLNTKPFYINIPNENNSTNTSNP